MKDCSGVRQGKEMSEDQLALIMEISDVLGTVLNTSLELKPDMNIVNDLGLDSIAVMNFTMALEDRFDISIPLNDMASVVTVRDLLRTIETLRSAA